MRSCVAFALIGALAGPAFGSGDEAASPAASDSPPEPPVRIGVAPFEGVTGPDTLLPDLATLLADRLARHAEVEVVGPAALGAPPVLVPEPEQVRRWAERTGLDAVIVGRATRASEPVSLDLRLLSGSSGEVAQSWFREMPGLEQASATVDALVPDLVAEVRALLAAPPVAASAESGAGFGLSMDSDQPLAIQSERLEAFQNDGARHLVFSDNVEVVQDDVKITARRLEAFYPAGSSKPDRLVATGEVVMAQGELEAHCDEATYERSEQRLVCRGSAELYDGPDRVAGQEIEFNLATESVTVSGSAAVVFHPGGDDREVAD